MSDQKKFGGVEWTAEDLVILAPRLSEAEATEWLEANEKHIRDRMVEVGWGVLEALLQYDGVDTSSPETFKEHDVVELKEDWMGMPAGATGTIVHVYGAGSLNPVDDDHELKFGASYEVEFPNEIAKGTATVPRRILKISK